MTTMKKMTQAMEIMAETMGKHVTMYSVIVFLRVCSNEGVTMKELTDDLELYSATLSNLVKKLSRYKGPKGIEGLDLIETTQDLDNRRSFALHLTPKGRELRDKMLAVLEKVDE